MYQIQKNIFYFFRDGEILYGVKNVKNRILHAKIGLVQGNKKRRCFNKRKSLTSSINSSMTSINKQNRVNYLLMIKN